MELRIERHADLAAGCQAGLCYSVNTGADVAAATAAAAAAAVEPRLRKLPHCELQSSANILAVNETECKEENFLFYSFYYYFFWNAVAVFPEENEQNN